MTTITSSTSPTKSSMTASLIPLPGGYATSPRPALAAPAYLQPLPLPVPAPAPIPDHHAHGYAQDKERARAAYTHFKKLLRHYLQVIDLQQQELAEHLGLQANVLSRKLNLTQQAFLTPAETKRLVLKLAELEAITYQWQAIELLQTLYPDQNFKQDEWRSAPLNHLEGPQERPVQYPPAYPADRQTVKKKPAQQAAHANRVGAKASPSVTPAFTTPTTTTAIIEKPGPARANPLSRKQLRSSQLNPQAVGEFGRKLRIYASLVNLNQKGLANAIGMHSTTFGRRFKTTTTCPFSLVEVKQLIEVLTREGAISAVWQARELLHLLYPDSDFTKKELALPPLSKLSLLPSDNRQAGPGSQSMSVTGGSPVGVGIAAKPRPSAGPGIRVIGPVLDSEESEAIPGDQAEAARFLPTQAQTGQHGSQDANAHTPATGPGQLDQMLLPLATQLAQLLTGLVNPLAAITANTTAAAPAANTTSMSMSNQPVVMSGLPAPVAGQPAPGPQIAVVVMIVNPPAQPAQPQTRG